MKKWKEKPSNEEVEETIKDFFDLLKNEKLDKAKNLINHKFSDWERQIWSLWQDTYLIDLEEIGEEVEDESFEGNLWEKDLKWLNQLTIENVFHWDEDSVLVNVKYNNMLTDVSADFSIEKIDSEYVLTRKIIHVA